MYKVPFAMSFLCTRKSEKAKLSFPECPGLFLFSKVANWESRMEGDRTQPMQIRCTCVSLFKKRKRLAVGECLYCAPGPFY